MIESNWVSYLRTLSASAVHLETLPFYAGDPHWPLWQTGRRDMRGMGGEWIDMTRRHAAAGRALTRVRIFEDPPTEFQRYERWAAQRENIPNGESVRYATEHQAHEVGLLPDAQDFWLIDDETLLLMNFDETGHLLNVDVVTDANSLATARRWWELALSISKEDTVGSVSG